MVFGLGGLHSDSRWITVVTSGSAQLVIVVPPYYNMYALSPVQIVEADSNV